MQKIFKNQGFTLIELMITVAVVTILAVVAVPAYQDYTIRSQITEGMSLAAGAKVSVFEYFAEHGEYPSKDSDVGYAGASGKYITSTHIIHDGLVVATFGNEANKNITGKKVLLAPHVQDENVTIVAEPDWNKIFPLFVATAQAQEKEIGWQCYSNAAQKYLPSTCLHREISSTVEEIPPVTNPPVVTPPVVTPPVTNPPVTTPTNPGTGGTNPPTNPPVTPTEPTTPPVTSTTNTETRNLSCTSPKVGSITESRTVTTYSDGRVTSTNWSVTSDTCETPITSTTNTETRNLSCTSPKVGSITESRTVTTYSDGRVTSTNWSVTSDTCETPITSTTTTETRNLSCTSPKVGSITESRNVTTYSDGRVTSTNWTVTSENCETPVTSTTSTETRGLSCSSTQTGSITESRTVTTYSDGRVTYGEWQQTKNTCTTPPPTVTTENRQGTCPTGQTGTLTESRTATTPYGGTTTYSAWTTSSSTCKDITYEYEWKASSPYVCQSNQQVYSVLTWQSASYTPPTNRVACTNKGTTVYWTYAKTGQKRVVQ